jgi:hypothetical protein
MKTHIILILLLYIVLAKEEETISDAEMAELKKDPKYASIIAELTGLEAKGNYNDLN